MMLTVNEKNFEQEVLQSDKPVLVDFFATWCMPCKMFAPILEEFAEENADKIKVVKIDIDQAISLAQKYRVMSIPTLKLFVSDAEPRATFVGAMSKEELEEWVVENGVE